jgi:tagatose-6-phosphate ketose/aldose isomerase
MAINAAGARVPGQLTHAEIFQQPETWPETVRRVLEAGCTDLPSPVLTGAGTSAYAARAVQAAWPKSRAIPSTELVLDYGTELTGAETVVSFARSGDSPESVAVVKKIQKAFPGVRHVALTCNPQGSLARWPGVDAVMLDPRTNDRSLVMTSSYSNLVLAGLALARPAEVNKGLPAMCAAVQSSLEAYEEIARVFAEKPPARFVALASSPLFGAAREAWLKVLEMTAGRVAPLVETYLGVRHGPLSFLQPDTLVLCFVSSDPARRRYEMDLVAELRAKGLGKLIALAPQDVDGSLFDQVISSEASALPDYLRTPAEIVFPQLLAFHLSLRVGLDPDSPSPGGVINRVVQGVRIYED